ncbi:hypothetical protein D3C81_792180 [compost metagenome]
MVRPLVRRLERIAEAQFQIDGGIDPYGIGLTRKLLRSRLGAVILHRERGFLQADLLLAKHEQPGKGGVDRVAGGQVSAGLAAGNDRFDGERGNLQVTRQEDREIIEAAGGKELLDHLAHVEFLRERGGEGPAGRRFLAAVGHADGRLQAGAHAQQAGNGTGPGRAGARLAGLDKGQRAFLLVRGHRGADARQADLAFRNAQDRRAAHRQEG